MSDLNCNHKDHERIIDGYVQDLAVSKEHLIKGQKMRTNYDKVFEMVAKDMKDYDPKKGFTELPSVKVIANAFYRKD